MLARDRLHSLPLLGLSALLVLLVRIPWIPPTWDRILVIAGYLAALVMLWRNRDRPWIPLVSAGAALNSLVIVVNKGQMPILPAALTSAGSAPLGIVDIRHILAGPGTPLAVLGDSLPLHIGRFGAVVSPGDLLIAAGIAGFTQAAMSSGRAPG